MGCGPQHTRNVHGIFGPEYLGTDALSNGQGGACIALITATFVVSVGGLVQVAAWSLPSLIGVPMLEAWYRHASAKQLRVAP